MLSSQKKIFYYAKYLRKSTEEQDRKSIQNQNSVLDGVIERLLVQDMQNQYVYVDTYCDEDYTGTDSERPDFKRLLKDLSTGKVNMLLVTDLSRLSRNIAESIQYVQGLFVALEIRFLSTQLPMLDSYMEPERIYSLEIPMQSMMNENHCAETSFKVRRSFNRMREEGKFIGGFAPYGYQKDPQDKHKLIPDPEAVSVLRMVHDYLKEGKTISSIARILNERGILNPTAYKASKGIRFSSSAPNPSPFWTETVLKRLMLRPIHIGTLVQGQSRTVSYKIHKQMKTPEEDWFVKENMVEPIFTKEEQDFLQCVLNRKTRVPPKQKNGEVDLFSGFLVCADCGKAISRHASGKGYVSYVCRTYRTYKNGCTSHRIAKSKLEKAVLASIQKQMALAVSFDEVVKQVEKIPISASTSNSLQEALQARQREWGKISTFKRTIYEDWKTGEITQEEYREMKSEYGKQETRLQQIIQTLTKEREAQEKGRENPFFQNFLNRQTIDVLTREILIEFIDRILVHEGGNVSIRFKFADEYRAARRNGADGRFLCSYFLKEAMS